MKQLCELDIKFSYYLDTNGTLKEELNYCSLLQLKPSYFLSPNFSNKDFRKHVRQLCLAFRPDAHEKRVEGARLVFNAIQLAYSILADPIQRLSYVLPLNDKKNQPLIQDNLKIWLKERTPILSSLLQKINIFRTGEDKHVEEVKFKDLVETLERVWTEDSLYEGIQYVVFDALCGIAKTGEDYYLLAKIANWPTFKQKNKANIRWGLCCVAFLETSLNTPADPKKHARIREDLDYLRARYKLPVPIPAHNSEAFNQLADKTVDTDISVVSDEVSFFSHPNILDMLDDVFCDDWTTKFLTVALPRAPSCEYLANVLMYESQIYEQALGYLHRNPKHIITVLAHLKNKKKCSSKEVSNQAEKAVTTLLLHLRKESSAYYTPSSSDKRLAEEALNHELAPLKSRKNYLIFIRNIRIIYASMFTDIVLIPLFFRE